MHWHNALPRQFGYLDYIAQFTAVIQHLVGRDNLLADTMSRVQTLSNKPPFLSYTELVASQSSNEELKCLLTKETKLQFKKLTFDEDKTEIYCDVSTNIIRPYITPAFRRTMLDLTQGLSHSGNKATLKMIKERYVWFRMASVIKSGQEHEVLVNITK